MYTLAYSKSAIKQIQALNTEIKDRIISSLERIRIRPHAYVQRLVGCEFYKLRVGDYRVIMEIMQDKLIILVVRAGHRKNIYK